MRFIALFTLLLYFCIIPVLSQEYRTVTDGVEYAQFTKQVRQNDTVTLPTIVYVLRIDGTKAALKLAHAKDAAIGVETTSQIAQRYGALAAVNAGFFGMKGLFAGDAAGVLKIDGKLLSEPYKERAALGFSDRSGRMGAVFGNVKWRGEVILGESFFLFETALKTLLPAHSLTGMNRAREANDMLLFTPEFHRTTLTNTNGLEIIIENNVITAVRDSIGSSVIPAKGLVISCSGEARAWAKANTRVGMFVNLVSELDALNPQQTRRFRNAQHIVGGVSLLLTEGAVTLTWQREGAAEEFALSRHPRTAVGRMTDGRLLLVAVDGRQIGVSHGMTLQELAELLQQLGAADAINLDGGGSTTMVVQDTIVNKPSDATGERPVSDAILVFPRKKN